MGRDDFDDADQLRIGNDGIFMLTFFSKCLHTSHTSKPEGSDSSVESLMKAVMGAAFVHRPSLIFQAHRVHCSHPCSYPSDRVGVQQL